MDALFYELRRGDVSGARQVDMQILLDGRGLVCEDKYAVGEIAGLLDIVRDEEQSELPHG